MQHITTNDCQLLLNHLYSLSLKRSHLYKGVLSTIAMSGTTSQGRIAGTFIATLPLSGLLYPTRSLSAPAINFKAPALPPTSFSTGIYLADSTTVYYRSYDSLIEINSTVSQADVFRGLIGTDSFYYAVQDDLGEKHTSTDNF